MAITNNNYLQNANLEVKAKVVALKARNKKSKNELYIHDFYYKEYIT